jgi:hypothetical protein
LSHSAGDEASPHFSSHTNGRRRLPRSAARVHLSWQQTHHADKFGRRIYISPSGNLSRFSFSCRVCASPRPHLHTYIHWVPPHPTPSHHTDHSSHWRLTIRGRPWASVYCMTRESVLPVPRRSHRAWHATPTCDGTHTVGFRSVEGKRSSYSMRPHRITLEPSRRLAFPSLPRSWDRDHLVTLWRQKRR